MVRKFFAGFNGFLFSVLVPPLLLLGVLFSTWFDFDFVSERIVPESYEIAVSQAAKKLAEEKIDPPRGVTREEWVRSIVPPESYVEIVREGLREVVAGLAQAQAKSAVLRNEAAQDDEAAQDEALRDGAPRILEISFKNTKQKLLTVLRNMFLNLPPCTAEDRAVSGEDDLRCVPKEVTPERRAAFVSEMMERIDLALPTRITLDLDRYGSQVKILERLAASARLFPFLSFAIPALLVLFSILIFWGRTGALLRAVGGLFLVAAFEAFVLFLFFSNMPSVIGKLSPADSELDSIGDSALEIVRFLFQFPQELLVWCVAVLATIGIVAWLAGTAIFSRARRSAGSTETPKNGTLRKGSARNKIT